MSGDSFNQWESFSKNGEGIFGDRPGEATQEITSTAFLDERPIAESTGRPMGGPDNAKPDPTSMPEMPFTAQDFLKKPIVIRNAPWSTSMATGTQILAAPIDVPNVLSEVPSIQRSMLETFAFFRLALSLRVVVNTSKFHQGRLIVSVDPFAQMTETEDRTALQKHFNIYSATMLSSSQIDAARSNSCEVLIPWEHIQDYLTTNSKDSFDIMARVRITVLNQLDTTTGGTQTANVRVFMRAKDVSLNVPIYPHTTTIPSFLDVMTRARLTSKASPMMASGLSEILGGMQKSSQNAGKAFASAETGDFSGVADAIAGGLGGLNEVIGGFDFDKPADIGVSTINTNTPFAPLSHLQGVDTSVRLGTLPIGGYDPKAKFSGAPSAEMDIKKIMQRKGLVQQLTWTAEQPAGEILRRFPVLPGFARFEAAVGLGRPKTIHTFLSYLSSFHQFWRGSLEYEIDVVSTMMQTGRLGFCFVPNAVDRTHVPTVDELSNGPIAYYDLQGTVKRVNVTIPFQSALPRKLYVPWGSVDEDRYTDSHILGYFYIIVVNQLSSPQSTPQQVDLNVYLGAGADYEVSVLRQRPEFLFRDVPTGPPPSPPEMKAAGDDGCVSFVSTSEKAPPNPTAAPESVEEAPKKTTVCGIDNDLQSRESMPIPKNVISSGSLQVKRLNAFNEHVRSVKDLIRRYSAYRSLVVPFAPAYRDQNPSPWLFTGAAPGTVPVGRPKTAFLSLTVTPVLETLFSQYDFGWPLWTAGVPPDPYVEGAQYFPGASGTNLLVFAMSRMYALWRGGLRFKIQPLTDRIQRVNWIASFVMDELDYVSVPAGGRAFADYSAYPSHMGNFSQNSAIEIEVPYYSIYNQLVTTTTATVDPNALRNGLLRVQFMIPGEDSGLPKTTGDTTVFDATNDDPIPITVPMDTEILDLMIYAAAADDFSFAYLVCPPTTFSLEQIVAPPPSSLNAEPNRQKIRAWRSRLDAFARQLVMEKFF
jgi:hypothetical protein